MKYLLILCVLWAFVGCDDSYTGSIDMRTRCIETQTIKNWYIDKNYRIGDTIMIDDYKYVLLEKIGD